MEHVVAAQNHTAHVDLYYVTPAGRVAHAAS